MPTLYCAFRAGEFLDEALAEGVLPEGWEVYNPTETHKFEWWYLK